MDDTDNVTGKKWKSIQINKISVSNKKLKNTLLTRVEIVENSKNNPFFFLIKAKMEAFFKFFLFLV